jgi:hypothetical protein
MLSTSLHHLSDAFGVLVRVVLLAGALMAPIAALHAGSVVPEGSIVSSATQSSGAGFVLLINLQRS